MTDLGVQDAAAKADHMVNPAFLAASMIDERAPDIVEALNDMAPELAVAVLLHLPPDRAIEVLDQPGLEREPELVTLMPREAAAKLLTGVSADRVADIFHQVKEPHCSELLDLLDPDTRVNIRRLLQYPKDTAGSIMTTEFASVPSTYTVQQTLDYVRHVESSRETIYAIYVLDPLSKKLVKTITLRRLITGDPQAPVLSVAPPGRLITATPPARSPSPGALPTPSRPSDHRHSPHGPGRCRAADLEVRPARGAGRRPRSRHWDRHGRRRHRRHRAGNHRGRAEVRRHGGHQRAVHGNRLLADDEEARRLVVRAVPVRTADGIGDAGLRRRAREGDRADAVHPADHELGRQFRIPSNISSDTRIGLA